VAEDAEKLRHILLTERGRTERYTNPRAGGGNTTPPPRNRQTHGEHLLHQFEAIRQRAHALGQERAAVGLSANEDIYLQFEGESGHDLAIESLEDTRQGIELLTVQERGGKVFATVYVPENKMNAFVRKIETYLKENTPKNDLPKHRALIESISEVRAAVLDALWTDAPNLLPPIDQAIWWEVWLRKTANPNEALNEFRQHAPLMGLQVGSVSLQFPEQTVVLAFGTRESMAQSLDLLGLIAELRLARINPEDFMQLPAIEQADWVNDLIQRTHPPGQAAPAVCLLDTGVNRQHPLLAIALAENDCHSHHPAWGAADHHGHGTEMGGLALYGDLTDALLSSGEQGLTHCLESVKILPPPGFPPNEPNLYGAVTEQAVNRAEIQAPTRKRVVCMPVAVRGPDNLQPSVLLSEPERQHLLDQLKEFQGRGRPSSWSAAIDKITSGAEDEHRRLIVLSAGNTIPEFRQFYPSNNQTEGIHDPGQAWNALTVGAYTTKTGINSSTYPGWRCVAPSGDLSPASTTSLVWQEQWPLKPDICMEGGNMATDPATQSPDYVDSLLLLTTHWRLFQRLLTTTSDTSAAAALTARMAAVIQAEYPEFWPETVRALIVHSAAWTQAMWPGGRFSRPSRAAVRNLLRIYGHGVPDIPQALWSARNSLTLIVEDRLQPFDKHPEHSRYISRDMKLHQLPWPVDALRDLGEATVELRVTLSYFIEPNPGERGWKKRHRYASHGLRFDVNTPEEEEKDFKKRLSAAAREEEESRPLTKSDSHLWVLGPELRHKGSIHSDRWIGTAAELAARSMIGIFPVIGWWRERPKHNRWNRSARYALLISIHTPETDVDIYTPVINQIAATVET
jgi:hypothetical protein